MSLTRAWRALSTAAARFDDQTLKPPALWSAMPAPRQLDAARVARDWCLAGSETWAQAQSLVLAEGGAATDEPDAAPALAVAEHLACWMDGSHRLATLSRVAGLRWRLQVKLADAAWWAPRRLDQPWDAGWLRTGANALDHASLAFSPRRPTLVLALAADAARLSPVLAAWPLRAAAWAYPVRWLWVGQAPVQGDGGAQVFRLP